MKDTSNIGFGWVTVNSKGTCPDCKSTNTFYNQRYEGVQCLNCGEIINSEIPALKERIENERKNLDEYKNQAKERLLSRLRKET